jgi:hypothetical protein
MENVEKLETSLTAAVAVFYYVPMIGLIVLPIMGAAVDAF